MSYTRKQFADALLKYIGNSSPAAYVEAWVIAWTRAESGPESANQVAAYNLLNTTQPEPGSTFFNCLRQSGTGDCEFGVQNYLAFADGIKANGDTLMNGFYTTLYPALRDNDALALGSISNTPAGGVIADLGIWGTHGWQNIINNVDNTSLANESFTGSTSGSGYKATSGAALTSGYDAQGLANALEAIDVYSIVVNPFKSAQASIGGNTFLDMVDPIAAIDDSTAGALNYVQSVGGNMVQDLRGLAIRLLIVIVGLAMVVRVLLSFTVVQDVEHKAEDEAKKIPGEVEQGAQAAALA